MPKQGWPPDHSNTVDVDVIGDFYLGTYLLTR